jgi:hypothetical protein
VNLFFSIFLYLLIWKLQLGSLGCRYFNINLFFSHFFLFWLFCKNFICF